MMWRVWFCLVSAIQLVSSRGHGMGIIGGQAIEINRVPYMASIRLKGTGHWCGGSVIHDRYILTAAHCAFQGHEFEVVVGSTRLDEKGDSYPVEKMIVHPNYSIPTSDYDAALFRVSESIVLKDNVKKIGIAKKEVKLTEGTLLTVSGWGATETADISNNLLTVQVPYINTQKCQAHYTDVGQKVTERMICAGKKGRDSCTGDSGGALVYKGVQVGITSFGLGCGSDPGVYTKVSAIQDWVAKTINA